ncbi:hypothetical protein [Marinobacter sp. PE14]
MSIFSLEQKVLVRDDAAFKEEFFELLDEIERGKLVMGGQRPTNNGSAHQSSGIYPLTLDASFFDNQNAVQRLATAITALLCSPSLELSEQEIRKLLFYKTHLTDIFYLSDFGNMDHILAYRNLWRHDTGLTLKSDSDIFLLLICWTMNSHIKLPFSVLLEKIPQQLFFTLTAALYQFEQVQTKQGFDNFREVFNQFLELPEAIDLSACQVMLVNIWMGCSYWDIPDRHEIKKKINLLIRANFHNIEDVTPGKVSDRPRIAILVERYRSDHAMYRCFHTRIAELKQSYRTCLFSAEGDVDDISRNDAHECIVFDPKQENLGRIAKRVKKFQPDIILYPSLGMNIWTVCLANFRLAPIQVMGYGHPASAHIDKIDFGLLVGFINGPDYQKFCTEQVIQFRTDEEGDLGLHPQSDLCLFSPPITTEDEVIRIAVNSSLMKISDRVLQICKLLMDSSTRRLEFHFFPAHRRGFKLLAFQRKLMGILGDQIVVHEPYPYPIYQKALARCHFAIGSTPFGGTNTNTDSVLLTQPKLYILGKAELAESTDYNDFSRYNESAGFMFTTEIELIAKAIMWIHNPHEFGDAKRMAETMRETLLNVLSSTSEKATTRQNNLTFLRGIAALSSGKQVENLI